MAYTRQRAVFLGMSLSLLGAVNQAQGGVVDSPLPVLEAGATTFHIFTVPGVIKNNNLESVFACTSLEASSAIVIAVQVFSANGGPPLNDVTPPAMSGAETVLPGETRTIATGSTAGFHEDDEVPLAAASLKNGSARILATSKKIACRAFVTDEVSDPPISMTSLNLIMKKQRGD